MPDQYKYHDTFNMIPDLAVIPTNVQIVRQADKLEPMLKVPFKAGSRSHHTLPFFVGLNFVRRCFEKHDPFLPVLVKGDLRELDISSPYLQLHRICLPSLLSLSLFERADIENAINKKLRFIR